MRIGPILDEKAGLLNIRDPMIVPLDGVYYLTGTHPPFWRGVNDGVHLWSSTDLVHFTHHGRILKREDLPEDCWGRDRFWAPELFNGQDGWFYLTVSCGNEDPAHLHLKNIMLARSRSITGPYEVVTKEQPLAPEDHCIDANMFKDDDGTIWMGLTTGKKLMLYRFDPESLSLFDGRCVAEKGKEGEWDSIGIEGQCTLKRHGIYFQWFSSWTRGYEAGLLTAASMEGPWKKAPGNPVLMDTALWHKGGHNHSFRGFDGQDYLIFHAFSTDPSDPQMESMFIVPVEYKADGTVELKLTN